MQSNLGQVPIEIDLNGDGGHALRVEAKQRVETAGSDGAEHGSVTEQAIGLLAELAIRKELGLPDPPSDQPFGFDIRLPSGVTLDVKCRGGFMPFVRSYSGTGTTQREAKHNFFARQLHDESLTTDAFLMTHLRLPRGPDPFPGTPRQRLWTLYVCGWVSKQRLVGDASGSAEGVYLPRGSLTEQGLSWFTYRGQEVEFYHRHLNPLGRVQDILTITPEKVAADRTDTRRLHMTGVDAVRIAADLAGRGVLELALVERLRTDLGVAAPVPPILHENQYHHLLDWLEASGYVERTDPKVQNFRQALPRQVYEGVATQRR